jgi:3-hydroxyacyl-CoA dehydrogenase
MKEDRAQAVLENIMYTMDYDHIKNRDLVIEAAAENIPLKQKIFNHNTKTLPRMRDQIEVTGVHIQQT